jgi:hypothetical protein
MVRTEIIWVRNIIFLLLVLIAFFFAISTSTNAIDFWKSLGVQIVLLIICFIAYAFKSYSNSLEGIEPKTFWSCTGFGLLIGIGYIFVVSLIPAFSIGFPLVSNSIGSNLKAFIVLGVAPLGESIFFLGTLLGFLRRNKKVNKHLAIAITSIAFSFFHLGAWITGLYELPGFSSGFLGFTENITLFISAFIFNELVSYLVVSKKFSSIWIGVVIHFTINLFTYVTYAVTFAIFSSFLVL